MADGRISRYQALMNAAKLVKTKEAIERLEGIVSGIDITPTIALNLRHFNSNAVFTETEPGTDIKEEVEESSMSLLDLPHANDPEPATRHKNPYAGLTSSKKRKHADNEASPPIKAEEELFVSQGEDDETDSDHSAPDIKKERVPRRNLAFSNSNDAESSGRGQTRPTQARPFAPPKRVKVKKTTPHPTQVVATRTTSNPGSWYDNINMSQRFSRSDLETLKYVLILIKNVETGARIGEDMKPLFEKLRKRLHAMEFYDFLSGVLIRKSKVLEEHGLDAINEDQTVGYPWDVRADALALYRKWRNGVLDPHLLRGIDTKQGKNNKGNKFTSRNLEMGYLGRKSCNYTGAGNLVNGQWWPLQICALRDGAHGELEGGIHGQPGKWAYSIVLGGGGYSDVDEGNQIKYCGTSGAGGEPSGGTKLLKKAYEGAKDVRVLRSATLDKNNTYRPAKGLRYDGVYKITGYEMIDQATAMHRFTLRRRSHQDPIRCSGVESRPTEEELAEYSTIRGLIGLSN